MVWKYWRNKKGAVHDILIQFNPFFNLDSKILTLLRCYRKSLKWPKEQHLCRHFRQKTNPANLHPSRNRFQTFPLDCISRRWVYLSSCLCSLCLTVHPEVQTRSQLWPDAVRRTLVCVYQPQFVFAVRCDKCSGVVGHSQGEVFFLSYFSNAKRHLQNVASLDNMKPGTPC